MEVYAEYAFAENFLIDAMLLYVTFRCTRTPARALPLVIASSFGASFAVLYALIALPYALSLCVKIAAGGAMCLLAQCNIFRNGMRFVKLNTAQKLRRVRSFLAFTAVFFLLSACLCGVFYAIDATGKALKAWQIPVCAFFVFACEAGAKRLFKERKIAGLTRACTLYVGDGIANEENKKNGVRVSGFIDSGNRAKTPDGTPICFLSPEIALLLINDTVRLQDFTISTVGGKKRIKIFRGGVLIYERGDAHRIKQACFHKVYFSPSAHLSGDRVLLPADCLRETEADGICGKKEDAERFYNGKKQIQYLLSDTAISEAAVSKTVATDTETDETQKNNKNKDKAKAKQRGKKR